MIGMFRPEPGPKLMALSKYGSIGKVSQSGHGILSTCLTLSLKAVLTNLSFSK